MINRVLTVLALGLAAASFASPTFAQDQDMAKRDAAVAKCSAEAQRKVPNQDTNDDVERRMSAYQECMKTTGFPP